MVRSLRINRQNTDNLGGIHSCPRTKIFTMPHTYGHRIGHQIRDLNLERKKTLLILPSHTPFSYPDKLKLE
jgi:hypothetical protein